jgi:hypothetical protein
VVRIDGFKGLPKNTRFLNYEYYILPDVRHIHLILEENYIMRSGLVISRDVFIMYPQEKTKGIKYL